MRKSIIMLGLLLCLNFANAVMNYKIDNIKIIAYPNETLVYNLTIINNDFSFKQIYINKIFIENTFKNSQIDIKPSINQLIPANESKTFTIRIPVTDEMALGFYKTIYNVTLLVSYTDISTGSTITKTDHINLDAVILNKEKTEITNISVEYPESINPNSPFNITFTTLADTNLEPLFNIIINNHNIIYNQSFNHNLSYGINLFKKEIYVPSTTLSGKYNLIIKAIFNDKTINISKEIYIAPFKLLKESINKSENIFGKKIIKTIINEGNTKIKTSINYTTSFLESFIPLKTTYLNRNIQPIRRNNNIIVSNITLNPGEKATLIIYFDYSIFIIVPLIIFGLILLWFYLTRKVSISKEIIQLKKEGNEVIVKVGIIALNTSHKSLYDVKIIDTLPLFAKKAGAFGSVKGEVDTKKRIIKFPIGKFNSKEEVLLTYKFKTDMELIGKVQLPPAIIKFKINNETNIVRSNTPLIQL